jgi:thiosulfate dehydrogenase [quinone] large subunit
MMRLKRTPVEDPAWAKALFEETRFAWLWAILRIYLGYQWLTAGLHKVENPAWVTTGEALKAFWTNAIKVPAQGKPPITYDWYREFLRALLEGGHYTWFAKLVAYGELVMGILLILGLFTGFAAFAGAFANFNFMLAGTASTNPVLFIIAILLILAWKVAGLIGLDYWVLPMVGTPWRSNRNPATMNAG